MPCFDPLFDWVATIEKYYDEIQSTLKGVKVNLILVNDGTTRNLDDDIIKLKDKLSEALSVIELDKNYGKGFATRKGIEISNAEHIIFTDVDFPYSTDSLISLHRNLVNESSDVVIGIRDKNYYNAIPKSRKKISTRLKKVNQKLFKLITSDTQCGLKGMNKKGKELLLQTKENRYLFDLEFVKLISKRDDLNIKLQTVRLREGVSFSKVPFAKIIGESFSYLKILLAR